jgi:DNA-directed RNA polymerase subunit M/transcription elongation factor TFIIS
MESTSTDPKNEPKKLLTPDEIDRILGVENEEQKGLYYCSTCKTDKHTTFTLKQTRSADEGMTAFVFCSKCQRTWKKN